MSEPFIDLDVLADKIVQMQRAYQRPVLNREEAKAYVGLHGKSDDTFKRWCREYGVPCDGTRIPRRVLDYGLNTEANQKRRSTRRRRAKA